MGIPSLRTQIEKRYPSAFIPLNHAKTSSSCDERREDQQEECGESARGFDHAYFDMNNVMHVVLRRAVLQMRRAEDDSQQEPSARTTEDDGPSGQEMCREARIFYRLLGKELDRYLRVLRPRKSVMFAVDGPPPLAKAITQRGRRQAEMRRMTEKIIGPLRRCCDDADEEEDDATVPAGEDDDADGDGDGGACSSARYARYAAADAVRCGVRDCLVGGMGSLLFTPGTLFMPSLESFLIEYGQSLLLRNGWTRRERDRNWALRAADTAGIGSSRPFTVEISGSSVHGEGEAKIMKVRRTRCACA